MKLKIKGIKVNVTGTWPTVGEPAPAFTIKDIKGDLITNEDLKGQTVLISTFPDIDTRICALQTRHFYEVASEIKDVKIINLSNNNPKNLEAWCATNGIDTLMAVDTDNTFALNYGIWINSIKHLSRAIFIIDKEGILRYADMVEELSSEPDYDSALNLAKSL